MTRLRKPEGRRDFRTTESENPSHLKCTPKVRHKTFGVHYV